MRKKPFTALMVLGLAGAAYSISVALAAILVVGFDTFLRTGELFTIKPVFVDFSEHKAIIKLVDTKTSKRKVADECVVVESKVGVRLLREACSLVKPGQSILDMPAARARNILRELLMFFELDSEAFNFYSLRRGGATAYFFKSGSMEKTLAKGRWESASTARIYIQDAAAQAAELALSPTQHARMVSVAGVLKHT